MWFRVVDVGTVGGLAYLRVDFWPDKAALQTSAPSLVEEFLLDRPEEMRHPVTDTHLRWRTRSGTSVVPWVEVDGDWVPRLNDPADPYLWQSTAVDVAQEALNLIAEFATTHSTATGDMTDPSLVVERASGIAARADMQALVGAEREV